MRWLSSSIILILCACTPYHISYEQTPLSYPSKKGRYYLVKKGDTLWDISKATGVSVKKILNANEIPSPKKLKAGQRLFIPHSAYRRKLSPFIWPLKGKIINFFGDNVNNVINQGINIKAESGEEIKAAADGYLIFSDHLKGWGQTLILKHSQDFYTIYANLNEVLPREGSYVTKGKAIAKVAQTPQGNFILHFEIRKRYLPHDPLKYLPR